MRTTFAVLMAGILAIVATLISAELVAFVGGPRDGMGNVAICCFWLMVVFGAMRCRQNWN